MSRQYLQSPSDDNDNNYYYKTDRSNNNNNNNSSNSSNNNNNNNNKTTGTNFKRNKNNNRNTNTNRTWIYPLWKNDPVLRQLNFEQIKQQWTFQTSCSFNTTTNATTSFADSTRMATTQPQVRSGSYSLDELQQKTNEWIHTIPLGSWTGQELSYGRFMFQQWWWLDVNHHDDDDKKTPLVDFHNNKKKRAYWTRAIVKRWIQERKLQQKTNVVQSTSAELLEMFHRVLHASKIVLEERNEQQQDDDEYEDYYQDCLESIEVLHQLRDAAIVTQDERLQPGDKAYTMALNLLANVPKQNPRNVCEEAESLLQLRIKECSVNTTTTTVPDIRLFNACLHVYAMCSPYQDDAPDRAQALLEYMSTTTVRPTATSFSSALHAHATNTKRPESPYRAQAILDLMIQRNKELADDEDDDVAVVVDPVCFNVCMNAWSKANEPQKAEDLLWRMHRMAQQESNKNDNNITIRPDLISFHTVLNAWAKSGQDNADEKVLGLFSKIPTITGISPTKETYTIVLDALSRKEGSGPRVQDMVQQMEEGYQNGTSSNVCPTKQCYLYGIRAWGNTNHHDAPEKAEALLEQMIQLGNDNDNVENTDRTNRRTNRRRHDLEPCVILYSAIIDAWSKSNRMDASDHALRILRTMEALAATSDKKKKHVAPNTIAYNSVLAAFAKRGQVQQAEDLFREMKFKVSNEGNYNVQPDTITFSTMIHAYSKNNTKDSPQRATRLFKEMMDLYHNGNEVVKPTVRTYTSLISVWGNHNHHYHDSADQAEDMFWNLYHLYKQNGDEDLKPNIITLNSVLKAWSKSNEGGAAKRAEKFFHRTEQELTWIEPDCTTFLYLMSTWAKSGRRIAPNKAELYFDRLKDVCTNKRRRRRQQQQQQQQYKLSTAHFNAMILAWSKSTHRNAVARIESLMEEMTNGDGDAKPNVTTYNYYLNAIARSNLPNRVELASNVVREMKQRHLNSNSWTEELVRKCSAKY